MLLRLHSSYIVNHTHVLPVLYYTLTSQYYVNNTMAEKDQDQSSGVADVMSTPLSPGTSG